MLILSEVNSGFASFEIVKNMVHLELIYYFFVLTLPFTDLEFRLWINYVINLYPLMNLSLFKVVRWDAKIAYEGSKWRTELTGEK